MEELIHLQNDSNTKFYEIWRSRIEFKQPVVYIRYTGNENASGEAREGKVLKYQ